MIIVGFAHVHWKTHIFLYPAVIVYKPCCLDPYSDASTLFTCNHRYSGEDERDVSSSTGDIPRNSISLHGSGGLIMRSDACAAAVENSNGWSRDISKGWVRTCISKAQSTYVGPVTGGQRPARWRGPIITTCRNLPFERR